MKAGYCLIEAVFVVFCAAEIIPAEFILRPPFYGFGVPFVGVGIVGEKNVIAGYHFEIGRGGLMIFCAFGVFRQRGFAFLLFEENVAEEKVRFGGISVGFEIGADGFFGFGEFSGIDERARGWEWRWFLQEECEQEKDEGHQTKV